MLENSMNSKFMRYILIIMLLAMVLPALGYEERGRRGRSNDRSARPENPRREEKRQQTQESFKQIDELLRQVLETANRNECPEATFIEEAQTTLRKNKQLALSYDSPQKTVYMLLQAWCDFYDGNLQNASRWSLRACKEDANNQDAWVSQTLFSLLAGAKPMEQRAKRDSRSQSGQRRHESEFSRPRRRNGDLDGAGRTPMGFGHGMNETSRSHKGILDFDLRSLNKAMLQKRFERFAYMAADGSEVIYVPETNIMCLFFWQAEPVSEPNDVETEGSRQPRNRNTGRRPSNTNTYADIATPAELEKVSLEKQRPYFEKMSQVCRENDQVLFAEINTNELTTAEGVIKNIPDKRLEEGEVPIVFAADPESGAEHFIGTDARTPFMAVIGKDGKVKYAGVVQGFFPAIIVSQLTDIEMSLDKLTQSRSTSSPSLTSPSTTVGQPGSFQDPFFDELMGMDPMMHKPVEKIAKKEPPRPAVDPNSPAVDPNEPISKPKVTVKKESKSKPAAKPKPAPKKPAEKPELSLADQVAAEKLLTQAEVQIETCRKLPGKSPLLGIQACRKVREKYPNTEYAEKARYWLRKVPEKYREKYEITDEELGY